MSRQVRLDDDVADELAARCDETGRSLSAEASLLLRQVLVPPVGAPDPVRSPQERSQGVSRARARAPRGTIGRRPGAHTTFH